MPVASCTTVHVHPGPAAVRDHAALLAVELRGAVYALAAHGDCTTATRCVDVAETMLRESAPLFSLLATMRVERSGPS
jgi:hypothetical protein